MINFFRNIRRQLANENRFQKYFRYAFGEILLVVIGILIALQVNNWNEQRKQDAQFKVTLEQLYTSIKYDAEAFYRHSLMFNNQVETIDLLLKYPLEPFREHRTEPWIECHCILSLKALFFLGLETNQPVDRRRYLKTWQV